MLFLAQPRQADQVQRTLRLLAGRWYADPALLGDLMLEIGMERQDRACLDVSLGLLGAAVALDDTQPTTLNSWAVALAVSGRPGDADAAFARALELEPRNAALYVNLASHLERTGRASEAARARATAAALDPRLAGPRNRPAAPLAPPVRSPTSR